MAERTNTALVQAKLHDEAHLHTDIHKLKSITLSGARVDILGLSPAITAKHGQCAIAAISPQRYRRRSSAICRDTIE